MARGRYRPVEDAVATIDAERECAYVDHGVIVTNGGTLLALRVRSHWAHGPLACALKAPELPSCAMRRVSGG